MALLICLAFCGYSWAGQVLWEAAIRMLSASVTNQQKIGDSILPKERAIGSLNTARVKYDGWIPNPDGLRLI